MRVDPARLSVILQALSRPDARAADNAVAAAAQQRGDAPVRDIERLKQRLRGRLQVLSPESGNFDAQAATITIQEILGWEFGERILDHPEFQRITSSITDTMLADARLAASMGRLVRELTDTR